MPHNLALLPTVREAALRRAPRHQVLRSPRAYFSLSKKSDQRLFVKSLRADPTIVPVRITVQRVVPTLIAFVL